MAMAKKQPLQNIRLPVPKKQEVGKLHFLVDRIKG